MSHKSTFRLFGILSLGLFCALPAMANSQAVKKAFVWDITENNSIKHGNIYLVFDNGEKRRITDSGVCSRPQIAPDGKTVGWREGQFLDYRDEKPTPYWETSLAFYREGKLLKSLGPFESRSLIGQWKFMQGGKKVALRRYGMHGQPAYELWDIIGERNIASWQEYVNTEKQIAPAWIAGIEED